MMHILAFYEKVNSINQDRNSDLSEYVPNSNFEDSAR